MKSDEISLKESIDKLKNIFLILISKWKIIILFCFLGSTIGFIYSKNKHPTYIAELTFTIENDKPMILGGAIASNLGFDLGGSNNEGVFSNDNMIELFKSRRMIEKSLLTTIEINNKTFTLADLYKNIEESLDLNYSRNKIFPLNNNKLIYKFSRYQDSIIGNIYNEIKNRLIIEYIGETSIIKVEMKYKNEFFAKNFLNTLAQVVSDDYNEMKTKKSKINMMVLQRQTDSVRMILNNAILGNEIIENNCIYSIKKIKPNRLNTLQQKINIEINTKLLTELSKQLEMSKISIRKDAALIQVIDKPILPLPKEEFGKIKGMSLGASLAGLIVIGFLIIQIYIRKLNI